MYRTIQIAEAQHPDLVCGQEWMGVDVKYWYQCKIHGQYKQSFYHHNTGHGCTPCNLEKGRIKKSWSIEEIEAKHPDFKRGQIWKGVNVKHEYICKQHGIYLQSFSNHNQGQRCPTCKKALISKSSSWMTIKQAEKRHSDLVVGQQWKGSAHKYRYICERHGEYLQTFNNHDRGKKCSRCFSSRMEDAVYKWLRRRRNGHTFQRQVRFPSCKNKRPLAFDFASEKLRILIECQGMQHYLPTKFGGKRNGELKLEYTKHCDDIKQRWARSQQFKLIKISYTTKNIEKYLEKHLGSTCRPLGGKS